MTDITGGSTPTGGDTLDFSGGGGSAGGGGLPFGLSPFQAGGLALGAGGLAYMLSQGPAPLPSEFGQLTTENVPWLESGANWALGQGQQYAGAGAQALQMAQAGVLTPEQQAQLSVYSKGLENTALQEFSSMGRNPTQDTAFISAQADIDARVNAMAQQQIQSTIALGLGEVQAGSSFTGQALGFENAAKSALIAAGQAQVAQDQSYSNALTGVFSAIGSIFGMAAKAAPLSDVALKTDIHPIGRLPNGIDVISFRFKWDWQPYVGVIAQQVAKIMPDAVSRGDDGWLRVDYDKVRAPFMRLEDWKRRHA
jgi:Chaperone of endosialidase